MISYACKLERNTYNNQRKTKKTVVAILYLKVPPSSPPTYFLLKSSTDAHMNAIMQNNITANPKFPGSTSNTSPLKKRTIAANVHAIPMPKNTFTALLPVTFPIEESAYLSFCAAILLANVSGTDVPNATKEIAVTESLRPIVHPKCDARSLINAVKTPITKMDTKKHAQPFK